MNVVAVVPLYPPHSLVGSWLSTHECMLELAARGHNVQVMAYMCNLAGVHEGITVHNRRTDMEPLVASADVVVSHLGDNGRAAELAAKHRVPSVRMGHGGGARTDRCNGAALVVWNSVSLCDAIGWDGPQIVVHPPVRAERYRTTPGDHITLVNLTGEKGVKTAWRCADQLPNHRFLGVRGGYGQQTIPRAHNFETIATTCDMRSVYSQTRVLLMPSAYETWGRVGVEAMCSGIPVIAHPTPGLLESLGPAGIFVDRDDIDGWVREIVRLDDPDEYAVASAKATARSCELDPTEDLKRFADALEGLCVS